MASDGLWDVLPEDKVASMLLKVSGGAKGAVELRERREGALELLRPGPVVGTTALLVEPAAVTRSGHRCCTKWIRRESSEVSGSHGPRLSPGC